MRDSRQNREKIRRSIRPPRIVYLLDKRSVVQSSYIIRWCKYTRMRRNCNVVFDCISDMYMILIKTIFHHFPVDTFPTKSTIGWRDALSVLPDFAKSLNSPVAPFIFLISTFFSLYILNSKSVSGILFCILHGTMAYRPGSNLCQ